MIVLRPTAGCRIADLQVIGTTTRIIDAADHLLRADRRHTPALLDRITGRRS